MRHFLTMADLKEWGNYAPSTIKRWTRSGILVTELVDGIPVFPLDKNYEQLIKMRQRKGYHTLAVWAPEDLPAYAPWHDALDSLVWLLCVHYSSRESLRKKKPRLDEMLTRYIKADHRLLARIKRAFENGRKPSKQRATQDIIRGWYHELSYVTPLRPRTLDLSASAVTECLPISAERLAFPTWRIVAAYYTMYFFIRATGTMKTGAFRPEEHQAGINVFKNNVANPLASTLWKYPLSLQAQRGKAYPTMMPEPPKVSHLAFAYASHPRPPHRTPVQLEQSLSRLYKRRLKHGNGDSYGLLDLMRDIRVWANYQDVDNLLKLRGGGFKAYLDRNLAVLIFFVGAAAELSYIAVCGPDAYLKQLQSFYDNLNDQTGIPTQHFGATPVMQRLEIYQALNLVGGGIKLRTLANPNEVHIPSVL